MFDITVEFFGIGAIGPLSKRNEIKKKINEIFNDLEIDEFNLILYPWHTVEVMKPFIRLSFFFSSGSPQRVYLPQRTVDKLKIFDLKIQIIILDDITVP